MATAPVSAGSTGRPDPGLFGPGSVAWRIHGDPAMALAGLRSLLLQAVHPQVLAGFDANTSVREDPWGRLQRTGRWVATVTYGTTAEAEQAGAVLRAVHRSLRPGLDPDTGVEYRVDDPDLLLWVHCTVVESFLSTYRSCGGAVEVAEADRYVDEMRVAARLVGLDPDRVPRSEAELEAYYGWMRPRLKASPAARRYALWGLAPPMPRWVQLATPARHAWAALVATSAAMLPRWARRLYGLPGLPVTDLTATVSGRALRTALTSLPGSWIHSPAQRAARERVATQRLVG